jgi:uncharacterized cupin superfamily protein
MTNINDPVFDEPREHPGFRCLRARLSRHVGSERLGLSLWEVPPGEAAYPYHHHLTEEELVLVLEGQPSLRTPQGWRELAEGEVVAFPSRRGWRPSADEPHVEHRALSVIQQQRRARHRHLP